MRLVVICNTSGDALAQCGGRSYLQYCQGALCEAALFGLVCIVPLCLVLSHDQTVFLLRLQSVVVSFLQQLHILTLTASVLYIQSGS